MNRIQRPYSLLKPAELTIGPTTVIEEPTIWDLGLLKDHGPLVIDFETTGLDVIDPGFQVVGMGFADSSCPNGVYFSFKNNPNKSFMKGLLAKLCRRQLIAHNVCYDAAVLERLCRDYEMPSTLSPDWPWYLDTISLYFHLSQHEWQGQSYSLKNAQVDVLGWDSRGDEELVSWLKLNGFSKNEMWRVPDDILGHYGCLDAQSTWQLYSHLAPQIEKPFPDTWNFIINEEIKYHYRAIVEMRFRGIWVDEAGLQEYAADVTADAEQIIAFLTHDSEATPWIESRSEKYEMMFAAKEPPKLTKTGKVSVRWQKWNDKLATFNRYEWLNFNSKQQLRELFYGALYSHTEVKPVLSFSGEQRTTKAGLPMWTTTIQGPNERIEHEWFSAKPEVPISKELLPKLGMAGKALHEYNRLTKLLGYVHSMLDSLRDGIHHGSLRPLGTMTGRCAGNSYNLVDGVESKVNLQQLPKDYGYLKCLKARPDHVLVDADVCYHPETEILTKRGWKTFDKLNKQDYVMQVNHKTLEGSFIKPSRIIWKDYDGALYTVGNRRGSLSVTSGHKMLYVGQRHKTRKDKENLRWQGPVDEGIPSSGCHLATAIQSNDGKRYPVHEIWMACMLQADGSLNKKATKNKAYRIEVSKPRKREKIEELLCRKGITKPPRKGQNLESETWYGVRFNSDLLTEKFLNLTNICRSQRDTVFEALAFWDGSVEGRRCMFTTTNQKQAEEVQTYFVTAGYEASIKYKKRPKKEHKDYYIVTINKNDRIRIRPEIDQKAEPYKGKVGCVTVEAGFVLVRHKGQCFVSGNCALEPGVLAELSQCPEYMKLYGPNAKPNDIYLFVASKTQALGERVRKYGYDPDSPTPEAIQATKKNAKKDRSIAKVFHLASGYGAGAGKIFKTLQSQGVTDITFDMAKQMHSDYWQLFKRVKEFEQELLDERKDNGGWFLDGLGNPVTVGKWKEIDTLNTNIQGTGHRILVKHIANVMKLRDKHNISFHMTIPDFHDEVTVECHESVKDEVVALFNEAEQLTNKQLGGMVYFKIEPEVCYTFADFKCE